VANVLNVFALSQDQRDRGEMKHNVPSLPRQTLILEHRQYDARARVVLEYLSRLTKAYHVAPARKVVRKIRPRTLDPCNQYVFSVPDDCSGDLDTDVVSRQVGFGFMIVSEESKTPSMCDEPRSGDSADYRRENVGIAKPDILVPSNGSYGIGACMRVPKWIRVALL